MVNVSRKTPENQKEFGPIIDMFLNNEGRPRDQFEKDFLIWFYSFLDYKDPEQSYWVNNETFKQYLGNEEYFYRRTKERILIEILQELHPWSRFLLATDYDSFRYGIDCIEQNTSWDCTWVNFTTDPTREWKESGRIMPIDFYRNPSVFGHNFWSKRGKWMEKQVYYFDENATLKMTKEFLRSMKQWNDFDSFLESYRKFSTKRRARKNANKVAEKIQKNVMIIL